MNGYLELAKMMKERENKAEYSPLIGEITSLPDWKIQVGSNVIFDKNDDVSFLFNISESRIHNDKTEYVYLNKRIVLLPYGNGQRFIGVGVINE